MSFNSNTLLRNHHIKNDIRIHNSERDSTDDPISEIETPFNSPTISTNIPIIQTPTITFSTPVRTLPIETTTTPIRNETLHKYEEEPNYTELLLYENFHFTRLDSTLQIKNILALTSIFENSTPKFEWDYCEDIQDGRGYTCGIAGFCSGTGDLVQVFQKYLDKDYNDIEARMIYKILQDKRKIRGGCIKYLKDTLPKWCSTHGNNENYQSAQIDVINIIYIYGSNEICNKYDLKLPISIGQIYDTCINHGIDGAKKIIKKIDYLYPNSHTIDQEIDWLTLFLIERKKVLSRDKTWKESTDRIKVYQKLVTEKNYYLNSPINISCYGDNFNI